MQTAGLHHRGSIFRLHVGHALLAREWNQLATWGLRSSASAEIRRREADHERRVSEYLATLTVVWLRVDDAPGPTSVRSLVERNSIALLSNALEPPDAPSTGWLGLHSPRLEIRQSGLWNLDCVRDRYDPAFITMLEELVSSDVRQSFSG